MNILIVTAMFPPVRTGTSFYSKNLAEALAERKHNVTVVTARNKEYRDDDFNFTVYRLPAIHIPLKNYFKHFRITSLFPQNYFTLSRLTRDCKAEVLLLINHYQDIAFLAIAAAYFNRIPLICSVGTQLQSANPRRDKILNILDKIICGHLVFPFCNRIISWDNQILQYLKDVHGQKVVDKSVIINYGVNGDPHLFMSHTHDYSLHNQILGVGAVIEQRNFIPLIRAFKVISDDFPNLRLKIIGHIYYGESVKLTKDLGLSNRVTFTGELPHDDVLNEAKRSDLYFVSLTGKYLGLGTATIESMLMGVPTVANVPANLLGTPTPFKDMENIILIDGTSVDQIASKIRLLLADHLLRKKIGQHGRQFVIENMSWDKIAERMEDLFVAVVEK